MYKPSTWLKFGLFAVGLGQSFAFVLVPPLARDLGLSVIETSMIFSISAVAWAITSTSWGRASDRHGRRNIAVIGLIGYSISIIALITPLFLVEKKILDYTKSIYIKGDVLFIEVSNPILKQEILYSRQKVIDLINDDLGKEIIIKIVLK